MRGLHGGQTRGDSANKILEAISRGLSLPKDDCPSPPKSRGNFPKAGPAADLLKVLLKMKCEKHSVAQKLIANSDDIDELARNDNPDIPALNGWRREIFGEDAIALKQGKLGLTAAGKSIQLVKID